MSSFVYLYAFVFPPIQPPKRGETLTLAPRFRYRHLLKVMRHSIINIGVATNICQKWGIRTSYIKFCYRYLSTVMHQNIINHMFSMFLSSAVSIHEFLYVFVCKLRFSSQTASQARETLTLAGLPAFRNLGFAMDIYQKWCVRTS